MLQLNRGDDPDTDDEESSLWSEEVIWASPLDDFDVYQVFTTTLKSESGCFLVPDADQS